MIGVILALMVSGAASAADTSSTVIALPVADGQQGNGPFTIQVWPDEGCKSCVIDPSDLTALRAVLKDVAAARGTPATYSRIQYLTVRGGSGTSATSSIDKVRKALAGCQVGADGKLAPNPTSSALAFGVRFDCVATRNYRWMSVVMNGEHEPRAVYLLPDGPIYAARTH